MDQYSKQLEEAQTKVGQMKPTEVLSELIEVLRIIQDERDPRGSHVHVALLSYRLCELGVKFDEIVRYFARDWWRR